MKFPIKDVTTKDDSLNEPRLAKELDEPQPYIQKDLDPQPAQNNVQKKT